MSKAMPSIIKRKGFRIPLEQRHLLKSYGRDPITDRMNACAHDRSLYTSNDMRPKGPPPPADPEQEAQPPPEAKADAQNPIISGG
jgi:hypothetical protein